MASNASGFAQTVSPPTTDTQNVSVTGDIRTSKREARRHHSTAVWLAEAKRTKEAIEEDAQAIACDPGDPGYQILMGHLLVENGDLTKALACYQQVYARYPHLREAISELVYGLQATMAMMDLDCVRNAPEADGRQSATKPDTTVLPVDPRPRQTAAREILHRFMADGRPIDDPTY